MKSEKNTGSKRNAPKEMLAQWRWRLQGANLVTPLGKKANSSLIEMILFMIANTPNIQQPVVKWGICPNCKGKINMLGSRPNRVFVHSGFCSDCGQAIDWTEE